MKKKEILAGYLYPAEWKNPGDPIYPNYWSEKPSPERKYHTQEDYDRYKKEMDENPPEEVLDIKPGIYMLEVSYPLNEYYVVDVAVPKKGITRQELMDIAAAAYHHIYSFVKDEYDGTDEWNKYGIWGHGMGDLTIHTFYIDSNKITLGVDS